MESVENSVALSITLNGVSATTRAASLAQLIEEQGYGGRKVATALNGNFVPERARNDTHLSAGDHIEILAPRQGG